MEYDFGIKESIAKVARKSVCLKSHLVELVTEVGVFILFVCRINPKSH